MEAKELTEWMLDEHEKINNLTDELRDRVTASPRGDRASWIAELRTRIDEYATRMCKHMDLEEQGGYLAQVTELRPTLSEAVEIIKNEHEELKVILAGLKTAVHELAPTDNLLVRDCCKRVEHLLTWLERHEQHETHIIMYAFTQDIGSPD
jgi:hemerythrin-like domain-containing protein